MMDRVIAVGKLIILFILCVLHNCSVLRADMIIPLSIGAIVILVFGFLHPHDTDIKKLFTNKL